MEQKIHGLLLVLVVLGIAWSRMGCGKSPEQLCSEARAEIVDAKESRQRFLGLLLEQGVEGPAQDAAMASRRKAVDDAARKARGIPNCSIGDLVGPMVGK